MSKQLLSQGKVLEFLKTGKTVQQIADEFKVGRSRIDAHVRRLRKAKLWNNGNGNGAAKLSEADQHDLTNTVEVKPTKIEARHHEPKELDYDQIVDVFLKKIEASTEKDEIIRQKDELIKEKDERIWRQDNIIAAQNATIKDPQEQVKAKSLLQERVKNISKKINLEQQKLVEESIK